MKTLLLIRHAKSGWEDPQQKDFDRTLTEQGKKDAPAMALRIIRLNAVPQLLLSSTAIRAKATAALMAQEWNYLQGKIIFKSSLYHCSTTNFIDVITSINNNINSAAIFSHNPGISEFADSLTSFEVEYIPPCGVLAVHIKSDNWIEFHQAKKELFFYEYPKLPE